MQLFIEFNKFLLGHKQKQTSMFLWVLCLKHASPVMVSGCPWSNLKRPTFHNSKFKLNCKYNFIPDKITFKSDKHHPCKNFLNKSHRNVTGVLFPYLAHAEALQLSFFDCGLCMFSPLGCGHGSASKVVIGVGLRVKPHKLNVGPPSW